MEEQKLLKLSLIVALFGTMALALIANNQGLEFTQINTISEEDIDTKVKIKGSVTNYRSTPKAKIFEIQDETARIKVASFQEEELQITQNDILEVSGKVTQYQGELEIIAEAITKFE